MHLSHPMKNPSSSSSSKHHNQKWPTSLPEPTKLERSKKKTKKKQQRNPFQDLSNGGIGSTSTANDSAFDKSCNLSSLSSIEAPRGCLRFFLSQSTKPPSIDSNTNNHRPQKLKSFSSRTPKSAPSERPKKVSSSKCTFFQRPISQKVGKFERDPPQSLHRWQSRKKPISRYALNCEASSGLDSNSSPVSELKYMSGELKESVVNGDCDSETANLTPPSKVMSGSCLNLAVNGEKSDTNSHTKAINSDTKTPPVHVSISPEIQCGSSVMSPTTKMATPACYGAGHVISGITDKRKCRPRGILTVREAKTFDCLDSDVRPLVNNSRLSMLPLPTEASMHWLKENYENGFGHFQRSEEEGVAVNSPASSSHQNIGFSPNLCIGIDESPRMSIASIISPNELLDSLGCLGPPSIENLTVPASEIESRNFHDMDTETSPFSLDSFSNRNVMQTPQSNSSSERQYALSRLCAEGSQKRHELDFELEAVTDHLQMVSLSSKSHMSIWDPTSSSFQFDCSSTPSNSVDLSGFQKVLVDRSFWFSTSTSEITSQSPMRISWREGLASRMFEMDEFDCCRCLSDEEDDVKGCVNDSLKSHQYPELNVDMESNQILTNEFETAELTDGDNIIDEKNKGLPRCSQLRCSCAESICTDGGGLVRSEDSEDWTICYKNHLFQV